MLQYGLEQLIKEPTGVTNDSKTLLKNVLVNHNCASVRVYSTPKISDHLITINMFCNNNVKTRNEVVNLFKRKKEHYFRNISNETRLICKIIVKSLNILMWISVLVFMK